MSVSIQPKWTHNVGRLISEGAEVKLICSSCSIHTPINLEKLRKAYGPLYSLWNRRPRCPTKRCRNLTHFSAIRPGAGVWPTSLRTEDRSETDYLHKLWQADRVLARKEDLARSWLLKRRGRRRKVRHAAWKWISDFGPAAVEEAEDRLDGNATDLEFQVEVWREVVRIVSRQVTVDLDVPVETGIELKDARQLPR